ncbi:MAG: DUF2232 domain-containing protein [Gemmatimonadaceae bacterium]
MGVVAFVGAPLIPNLRAVLPIERTWFLLVAVVAVCAMVGWMKGGRLALALIWIGIASLLFTSNGSPTGPYDWMALGWALLLAASFGLVSVVTANEPFFSRALSALAISVALGFGIVLVSRGGLEKVSATMAAELNRRVADSNTRLRNATSQPEWKSIFGNSQAFQTLSEESEAQLLQIPKYSAMLVPALLALESLAALALGWALYHRMSDVSIGPALGELRDFRFNDQLVWGVAVGASVFLLKTFADGKVAGLNVLVFFGFLYVLRGMGILAWMTRGAALKAMLIVATIFSLPLMAALAFVIGLGDTWLDWRSRAGAKPS